MVFAYGLSMILSLRIVWGMLATPYVALLFWTVRFYHVATSRAMCYTNSFILEEEKFVHSTLPSMVLNLFRCTIPIILLWWYIHALQGCAMVEPYSWQPGSVLTLRVNRKNVTVTGWGVDLSYNVAIGGNCSLFLFYMTHIDNYSMETEH